MTTIPRTVLAVSLLATAWASAAAQSAFSTGLDATFPPMSMSKLGGGVEGYFVDVSQEVARRMGRKLNVEVSSFSGLIPGLASGKYDWLAPTVATRERAANLLFTEGFVNTDYQFLVKKSDPEITALEQLKGKRVAINKGSIFDKWCAENSARYGLGCDVYDSVADAIQAVLSGRAAAALANDFAVKWAGKQNPLVKPALLIKTGQVFAISTRKTEVALRDQLSMTIKCMKQDGTLAKLHEKWLGVPPAADSVIRSIDAGHGVSGLEGYDARPVSLQCS